MIGILDSGSGGLTVMRALREELPSADIVYFGDIKNAVGGRQHDNRRVLCTLCISNQSTGLVAIQFWHGDVKEDQVRLETPQHSQGLVAVLSNLHLTPHAFQSK